MKKKKFKGVLNLNKNIISNLNKTKVIGGAERSERRTNCDQCPNIPQETDDNCMSFDFPNCTSYPYGPDDETCENPHF